MGDAQRKAEEDEQARPRELVVDPDRDGVRWKLGRRVGAARRRVRVPTGDEERVRRGLRAVADRVGGGIAHPPGHPPADEAGEPGEHRDGDHEAAGAERGEGRDRRPIPASAERQHEGGDREHEAHGRPEPPLLRRRVDLDVDRVAPVAAEAGVGIGGEAEVREEMRRVARVVREEVGAATSARGPSTSTNSQVTNAITIAAVA